MGVHSCWSAYRGCRTIQVIGEAALRISALTRDLGRSLQKSVNDSLRGLKAPNQNALTDLQRKLRKGELDLAKASDEADAARKRAKASEADLVKIRQDETATTEQVTAAEDKHRRSLLELAVAVDKVGAAEDHRRDLMEKLHRLNTNADRDNKVFNLSLGAVRNSITGLLGGLGKTVATGGKLALIGVAAGGAVAGVTSLTLGVGALVAALGQAAGAAGLLPAVLATKYAILGTVKLAAVGMGDALKAVAEGDNAKLQESLDKLAPSARRFVLEVNKVKPTFDRMRLDVQQRVFDGLAGSVGKLSQRYLPVANQLFGSLGDTMNRMARDVINFALSTEALGKTQTTVNNIKSAFGTLGPAMQPAIKALLDIVSVGSTFLPQLFSGLSSGIQGFSARISEMAANGELQAFFQRALDTLRQLGRIAGNVGGILSGVFNAAKGSGSGLLDTLERMTESVSRFVNSARGQSALTGFFTAMRTITAALMPVLMTLASVIGTTLAPIIANLAQTILPVLNPLFEALGRLLQAAAPLIAVLAEAFAQLLTALTPVIDMFAQALTDVMPQLTPVIAAIGAALVQLIAAAAPLLPLFVQLLAAILPILPPIIQLAAALIPPLIAIIQALLPIIVAMVQAFVAVMPVLIAVANVIAAILVPAIQIIAAIITGTVNVAVAIFTFFVNFVKGAVSKIVAFFGFLGSLPGRVAGWFASIRDGAIARAIGLVNWIKGLPGRILGALGNLGSLLLDAGRNLIMGLLNGLKNAAGAVIDWIGELCGNIADAVLGFFGIGSPSKMFAGIGRDLGRGLIVGIQRITPEVTKAAEIMAAKTTASVRVTPAVDAAMASRVEQALTTPAAAGTTPAGGDGASLTDPEALADAVARGMEGVQVVISESEITSKVNRRNTLNRRR